MVSFTTCEWVLFTGFIIVIPQSRIRQQHLISSNILLTLNSFCCQSNLQKKNNEVQDGIPVCLKPYTSPFIQRITSELLETPTELLQPGPLSFNSTSFSTIISLKRMLLQLIGLTASWAPTAALILWRPQTDFLFLLWNCPYSRNTNYKMGLSTSLLMMPLQCDLPGPSSGGGI